MPIRLCGDEVLPVDLNWKDPMSDLLRAFPPSSGSEDEGGFGQAPGRSDEYEPTPWIGKPGRMRLTSRRIVGARPDGIRSSGAVCVLADVQLQYEPTAWVGSGGHGRPRSRGPQRRARGGPGYDRQAAKRPRRPERTS